MFTDMDEYLKLFQKVIEVLDRAIGKTFVTRLRYNVEKPEISYYQVRILAKKQEGEKFEQNVYVTYKFQEFIYLLDVMISVHDKVFTNKHICFVL